MYEIAPIIKDGKVFIGVVIMSSFLHRDAPPLIRKRKQN